MSDAEGFEERQSAAFGVNSRYVRDLRRRERHVVHRREMFEEIVKLKDHAHAAAKRAQYGS